jgi:hypothetical protein
LTFLASAGLALAFSWQVGAAQDVTQSVTQSASPEPYLVKDVNAEGRSSNPIEMTDVNGTLFFACHGRIIHPFYSEATANPDSYRVKLLHHRRR